MEYPHLLKRLPIPWRALCDFRSLNLLSSCLPCLIPIACRPLPNVCTALKPAVCGKHTGTRKALARASRKTRKIQQPPTLFYTNRKQLCENNLILNNTHGSVSPCISSCCFLLLSLLFPSQQYSALNSHLSHPQGLAPGIPCTHGHPDFHP